MNNSHSDSPQRGQKAAQAANSLDKKNAAKAARDVDAVYTRRLLAYLQPHLGTLGLGVLCSVAVAGVQLGVGYVMKDGVQSLTTSIGHANLDSVAAKHAMKMLVRTCWLLPILYLARALFSFGQNVLFAEVGQRVQLNLRRDIYIHLQRLSLSFFDKHQTGNLMSTIANDVPVITGGIMSAKDIVGSVVISLGALLAILKISWQLSLLVFAIFPILATVLNRLSMKLRSISNRTQSKLGEATTTAEETLAAARLVRSFVAEDREIKRFTQQNEDVKKISMEGVRQSSLLAPFVDVIGAIGVAGALLFGGMQVIAGHMTFPNLILFIFMLDKVRTGVGSVGGTVATWRTTQGVAERVFTTVLDVPTEVIEVAGAKELPAVNGEVRFDKVSFEYIPGRPVLQEVSFVMKPGEVVAVVGPSGAGKSTVADLIPRFYNPSSGTITVDGTNTRDVTIRSLRSQIGIVDQVTMLFGSSVYENIAYGAPGASMDEVVAAARHANAHTFISELERGYDTIIGQRGIQLSGGQRQRLAIARALLSDPRILILDEATSSLDAASEVLVQEALEILMKGRTTLVIAHRLSTIVNANKILVLDSGRILETGTHEELIAVGGRYAALYESQFRGGREEYEVTSPA